MNDIKVSEFEKHEYYDMGVRMLIEQRLKDMLASLEDGEPVSFTDLNELASMAVTYNELVALNIKESLEQGKKGEL